MTRLSGDDLLNSLEALGDKRDEALEGAVSEGYKLLLVARWSGNPVPAELEVDAQVEEIVSALPIADEEENKAVRGFVKGLFDRLEEVHGNVA